MSSPSRIESNLESLPTELWLKVLSWLTVERETVLLRDGTSYHKLYKRDEEVMAILKATTNDLRNVCLTSRLLNIKTQPTLYERFDQASAEPRSIVLFLRTILRQPDFALHVKRLTMTGNLALLLLWQTVNLSELSILLHDDISPGMVRELIVQSLLPSRNPDYRPPFGNLRRVKIWLYGGGHFSQVSPWLMLPSLQILHVETNYASEVPALTDLGLLNSQLISRGSPILNASITSLVIKLSTISADELTDILNFCKALTSLEIEWQTRPPPSKSPDMQLVGQALLRRKDTLKKLVLDMRPYTNDWYPSYCYRGFNKEHEMKEDRWPTDQPPLCSFQPFEKLAYLDVEGLFMYQWLLDYRKDILPPTLEVLRLPTFDLQYKEEVNELIEELASEGPQQCYRLRLIEFHLRARYLGPKRGTVSIHFNQWGFSTTAIS